MLRLVPALWLVLLLSSGLAILAQPTAVIEGIVFDPSGLPAPGAEVTLVHSLTGFRRSVVSGEDGWYRFLAAPPGPCALEVRHRSFEPRLLQSLYLEAGRLLRVDVHLSLQRHTEKLEVPITLTQVGTSPVDWTSSIRSEQLQTLPLSSRDLFDLAAHLPGSNLTTNTSRTFVTGRGARYSVNGTRPNQNNFRLDGVTINDATGASPTSATGLLLGIESIQEVQLISTPFDAEYGRSAGAVLAAISKSGSNRFQGSLFNYLRNSALNARNFFDSALEPVPPLRKNHFGTLLSGPLTRNRRFFLLSYEGGRQRAAQTRRSVVPAREARLGYLPTGFVSVSPAVKPYLALYPEPNGKDFGDGTAEFVSVVRTRSEEDLITAKIDLLAGERWYYCSRYTADRARVSWPEPLLIFEFLETSRYHFLHDQLDWVSSPRTVHTLRGAFSRVWNFMRSDQPPQVPASLSFIPGRPFGFVTFTTSLAGLGGDRMTGRALLPRRHVINDYQLGYVLNHAQGSRTVRAGIAFDRVHFNQLSEVYADGSYTFASLSEFLQAKPSSGMLMLPGSDTARGWRQNILAAFVQTGVNLGARASLSVGLRYETYSTPREVNGKEASVPGNFFTSDSVTVGAPLFRNPSRWNFAPRAGFSYALGRTRSTIIRLGGGLFHEVLGSRELIIAGVRMPPFFQRASLVRPSFPNLLAAAASAAPENTPDMLDHYLLQPYVLQAQFQVQRPLPHQLLIQAGYVTTRGIHLMGLVAEYNPNRPQILSDGQLFFPLSLVRLNPAFGTVAMRRSQFDSSYHALQLMLSGRPRSSLSLQAKYSWGKSIDNCSSSIYMDFLSTTGVPTVFDYRSNRGRSDFDLRHTMAANLAWTPKVNRVSPLDKILGGWSFYFTLLAQSGTPFNPTVGFDRARLSSSRTNDLGQRPVLLWPVRTPILVRDPQRWFDPEAFGLPPAGMLGNLGRNTLEGAGLFSLDFALHRWLWQGERNRLSLRAECFNLTNHPNFQTPSARTLFDSSGARLGSAGQITSTTTPARQIQLALRWEF